MNEVSISLAQNYLKLHQKQLKIMLQNGYFDQISIQHQFYGDFTNAALIYYRLYNDVFNNYIEKNPKNSEMGWFVMALAASNQPYSKKQQELCASNHKEKIHKIRQWIKNIPPKKSMSNKKQHKQIFERLIQKNTNDDYLNIASVPVYLICCKWLKTFYSDENQEQTLFVDNRSLVLPIKYFHNDSLLLHLNYQVSRKCFENTDFKIINFETWQYLKSTFGGFQVKRFTTPEKHPIVQIWYPKIQFLIVQDQYIHCNSVQLLISRFETLTEVLSRLKTVLLAYDQKIIDLQAKSCELIRVNQIKMPQLISMIQDGNIQEEDRMEIIDIDSDIQGASLIEHHNILILNFKKASQKSLFHKVKKAKLFHSRPRCHKCGIRINLQPCICKTVYFCSSECRKSMKQHLKQCGEIIKEEQQLEKLLDYYETTRRFFKFQQCKKYGFIGLDNIGNTCYLNSSLQCILKIQTISEYFISNQHIKDLNVRNVLGTGGHLACIYAELVKDYYTTNRRSLTPVRLMRVIAQNQQFRGNNHQDSQQFLNYFLDKLHQDLNRVKQKPYIAEVESNGRQDAIVSEQSWYNYRQRNQSFISEQLSGQYRSEIRCPDCLKISITFDPFMSVTLPFPKPQKTDILSGYYLTPSGEFLKVSVTVKPSMLALQFYLKNFQKPMCGVHLEDKRVKCEWQLKKSIFLNKKEGLLLFYDKPANYNIELNVEILSKQMKILAFNRRIYLDKIQDQQQLLRKLKIFMAYPLSKAMRISQQQFIANVPEQNLMTIISAQQMKYPFESPNKLTIGVQINENAIQDKIKWDYSSKSYPNKSSISKMNSTITLNELITAFEQPERLTEDNAWYCNKCKDHKLADKIMCIYKLPLYLIIHLKRFNHRGRYVIYGEKVETPIKLKEYEYINEQKYQLIGIVNHFGTLTFGHYTAFTKKNAVWYYFDDESVKRADVHGNNAYLMFLRRCN